MISIQEIVDKTNRIPMLSQSSLRLLELVRSQKHNVQDITRLVECDPALTANLLKVVNAPAFGLGQPVSSLSRAISFLGDKMVVGIALATCSPKVFNAGLEGYEGERGELWRHSLRSAIASREIARHARKMISEDVAFTAGILHDIGKAVISEFLQGQLQRVLAVLDGEQSESFLQAEQAALGMDHCQVGVALAKRWRLPMQLMQVIEHHHYPARAENEHKPLVYVAHLGDIVAMMGGAGTGADTLLYPLDDQYEEYIEVSETDLEELVFTVAMNYEKTKTEFFA